MKSQWPPAMSGMDERVKTEFPKLREMLSGEMLMGVGYQVYAINPNAGRVEVDHCYPDLHSVPEPVEAVMIVTHPDVAAKIVRECADRGLAIIFSFP